MRAGSPRQTAQIVEDKDRRRQRQRRCSRDASHHNQFDFFELLTVDEFPFILKYKKRDCKKNIS
jgi:hypothetical protein